MLSSDLSEIREPDPRTDQAGNNKSRADGGGARAARKQQPQNQHEDPDCDAADERGGGALEGCHPRASGPHAAGQGIVDPGAGALQISLHEAGVVAVEDVAQEAAVEVAGTEQPVRY